MYPFSLGKNGIETVILLTLQITQCLFSYFNVISLTSEKPRVSESVNHNVIKYAFFS